MIRLPLFRAFAATMFVAIAYPQAKNVILFIGDGAGVSSLNAASIYDYGKPRQSLPHLALAERVIKLDNAKRAVGEPNNRTPSSCFSADHGYDLRLKGEHSSDALRSANIQVLEGLEAVRLRPATYVGSTGEPQESSRLVSLEDEHTRRRGPLLGMGPGFGAYRRLHVEHRRVSRHRGEPRLG